MPIRGTQLSLFAFLLLASLLLVCVGGYLRRRELSRPVSLLVAYQLTEMQDSPPGPSAILKYRDPALRRRTVHEYKAWKQQYFSSSHSIDRWFGYGPSPLGDLLREYCQQGPDGELTQKEVLRELLIADFDRDESASVTFEHLKPNTGNQELADFLLMHIKRLREEIQAMPTEKSFELHKKCRWIEELARAIRRITPQLKIDESELVLELTPGSCAAEHQLHQYWVDQGIDRFAFIDWLNSRFPDAAMSVRGIEDGIDDSVGFAYTATTTREFALLALAQLPCGVFHNADCENDGRLIVHTLRKICPPDLKLDATFSDREDLYFTIGRHTYLVEISESEGVMWFDWTPFADVLNSIASDMGIKKRLFVYEVLHNNADRVFLFVEPEDALAIEKEFGLVPVAIPFELDDLK